MSKSRSEDRWWDKIREILISDSLYDKLYFEDDDDRELIETVMKEGGTLSFYGHKETIYHVHFPYYTPINDMSLLPMCSCPSYRYQSFSEPVGSCKHIRKIFEFVGKSKEYRELSWHERSDVNSPWISF